MVIEMSTSIAGQLLTELLGSPLPDFFHQKIRLTEIDSRIRDFKLVAVLPLGTQGPIRFTWSSLGEEKYWNTVITDIVGIEKTDFLEKYPATCRKVLDTDGKWGEIFFDDLHQVGDDPNLVCRVYSLQGIEVSRIRKIEEPLREKLPKSIVFHPHFLACLSLGGMWCVRKNLEGDLLSVLWISESKWKQNIPQVQQLIEGKALPEKWMALKNLMQGYDLEIYPDGIEFFLSGRIDLSVAFL